MTAKQEAETTTSKETILRIVQNIIGTKPGSGIDAATRKAIAALQAYTGITVDSIIGPKTLEALSRFTDKDIADILLEYTDDSKKEVKQKHKTSKKSPATSNAKKRSKENMPGEILPMPEWFKNISGVNAWTLTTYEQAHLPDTLITTALTNSRIDVEFTGDELEYFLKGINDLDPVTFRKLMRQLSPRTVRIDLYTLLSGANPENDGFMKWALKQDHLVLRIYKSKTNSTQYITELAGLGKKVIDHQAEESLINIHRSVIDNWSELVFPQDQLDHINENTLSKGNNNKTEDKESETDSLDSLDQHNIDSKLSGYVSDDIESRMDQLDLQAEIKALCGVAASRDVNPPLSIGLFGDWGSGKSFFIKEMRNCISSMADGAKKVEQSRDAGEENLQEPVYWSNIAQISFNAWHYEDADMWASMVVNIFDNLAEHIASSSKDSQTIEEKRKQLFEQIQLVQKEVLEYTEALNQTRLKLHEVENEVELKQHEFNHAELDLNQIDIQETLKNSLIKYLKENKNLEQYLNELGLAKTLDSVEALKTQANDLMTESGQLKAKVTPLVNSLKKSKTIFLLIFVLVAGFTLSDYAIQFLPLSSLEESIKNIFTSISGLLTTALGYLAIFKKWKKPVDEKIKQVEEFYKDFNQQSQQTIKEQEEKIKVATQRRDEILEELNKKTQSRNDLIQQKLTLQNELEKMRAGRRLYSFIEEQATSEKYRGKLGIIASVREDFKRLSQLLVEQSNDKRDSWKPDYISPSNKTSNVADIDRIVLYIDDLDRCTPDRVVEVLHAVHLLLAFKLFVVVVAVDSRWLINSLKTSISNLTSEILENNGLDEDKQEDDDLTNLNNLIATPQNYLEKIFQIPYTLPQMTDKGFYNIMKSLSNPVDITQAGNVKEKKNNPGVDANPEPEDTQAIQNDSSTVTQKQTSDKPVELNDNSKNTDITVTQNHQDLSQPDNLEQHNLSSLLNKEAAYDIDLNPERSHITDYELAFMNHAFYGLKTPRSINRFVNTYRLIRSLVSEKQKNNYFNKDDGAYKAVIILLIILIGFSQEAEDVFINLSDKNDDDSLIDYIDTLVNSASNHAKQRRLNIQQAIKQIPESDKIQLKHFKTWAYPVSRFSFRPIRVPKKKNRSNNRPV